MICIESHIKVQLGDNKVLQIRKGSVFGSSWGSIPVPASFFNRKSSFFCHISMLSYKKKGRKNGWRRMWAEEKRWRDEEEKRMKRRRDLVFTSRADMVRRCYLAELSLHLPLSRLLHSWPPQSFSPRRSSPSLSLLPLIYLPRAARLSPSLLLTISAHYNERRRRRGRPSRAWNGVSFYYNWQRLTAYRNQPSSRQPAETRLFDRAAGLRGEKKRGWEKKE